MTLTVTGEPTCTEGAPPAPSILEIPTLNRAGLLLIGLLLAAAGVIALRRH